MCFRHHDWHIEQMIEMSMRDQDSIDLRRDVAHRIGDARRIRLNARAECDTRKVHAREVRIDQQYVILEFKLISICAEISHANSVARGRTLIAPHELRIPM